MCLAVRARAALSLSGDERAAIEHVAAGLLMTPTPARGTIERVLEEARA